MKIIKLNESNKKLKYEIYSMHLKQQKARRYREEQIKNLRFYRLIAHSVNDIENLKGKINRDMGDKRLKTIFGMKKVTIGKQEVNYTDKVKFSSFSKGVKLYPYTEFSKFSERDTQIQKRIIEQYIENDFGDYFLTPYDYNTCYRNATEYQSYYLFPNIFIPDKKYYNNGFCDNVVALSNEMAAMYFLQQLENADGRQLYEAYLRCCINGINIENRDSFMENVQFVKEAIITEQAIDTLANIDLIDKHELLLKISRDKVYTSYIK